MALFQAPSMEMGMALFQTSHKVIDPQLVPKKVLLTEGICKLCGPSPMAAAMCQSGHLANPALIPIGPKGPWVLPLGQMGQVIEEVEFGTQLPPQVIINGCFQPYIMLEAFLGFVASLHGLLICQKTSAPAKIS